MKLNNVLGMKVGKVIPRYCIQPILTDNTKKLVLWVHGYTVLIVNVLIGGDLNCHGDHHSFSEVHGVYEIGEAVNL